MAPKSQPATNLGPSAIDSDKQIVAWNTVLLPLKSGRERIKTQIDSLTLEEHFGSQPIRRRAASDRPLPAMTSSGIG